jgi:hypothetical protein
VARKLWIIRPFSTSKDAGNKKMPPLTERTVASGGWDGGVVSAPAKSNATTSQISTREVEDGRKKNPHRPGAQQSMGARGTGQGWLPVQAVT